MIKFKGHEFLGRDCGETLIGQDDGSLAYTDRFLERWGRDAESRLTPEMLAALDDSTPDAKHYVLKSGKIPKMPHLDRNRRLIHALFVQEINQHEEAMVQRIHDSHGTLFNSEIAREFCPFWKDNPWGKALLDEVSFGPSIYLAENVWLQGLNKPPKDPYQNKVAIIFGGPGSGKTTLTNHLQKNDPHLKAVVDRPNVWIGSLTKLLDESIEAGEKTGQPLDIAIYLPYRSVEKAIEGRTKSMLEDGRPVTAFSISHASYAGQQVMLDLARKMGFPSGENVDPAFEKYRKAGVKLCVVMNDSDEPDMKNARQLDLSNTADFEAFQKCSYQGQSISAKEVMQRGFDKAIALKQAHDESLRTSGIPAYTSDNPGLSTAVLTEWWKAQAFILASDPNFKGTPTRDIQIESKPTIIGEASTGVSVAPGVGKVQGK